tara:strand:- start:15103 stop:15300 length:198 start_codon:yes stop_codon:yes gene_type:complete
VLLLHLGLNYLFDIPVNITTQIILISVITTLATILVVLGLDGGIKRLYECWSSWKNQWFLESKTK